MPMARTSTRRYFRRRRRTFKPPVFMGKKEMWKRKNEISTKIFYFKSNGFLGSNGDGNINQRFETQRQQANPQAYNLPNIGADFETMCRGYCSYRVKSFKLELFPWGVGTESELTGISPNPFVRGNACTYINSDIMAGNFPTQNPPFYNDIALVINKGSAIMIRPRQRHTRIVNRPKTGFDVWGCCDLNVPIQDRIPDSWWSAIVVLVNGATANQARVWFWKVTMKVEFRGRSYVPLNQVPFITTNNDNNDIEEQK